MEDPENVDAHRQLNPRPETERKEPKAEDTENGKEDYNIKREILLLVAALIATVTFTAGLTLPGGFHSKEGRDQGTALLVRIAAFKAFVITNAIAMTLSVSAILVYTISLYNKRQKYLGDPLLSGMSLTFYALVAMMIAFMSGSYAVLGNSSGLRVGVLIIGTHFLLTYLLLSKSGH